MSAVVDIGRYVVDKASDIYSSLFGGCGLSVSHATKPRDVAEELAEMAEKADKNAKELGGKIGKYLSESLIQFLHEVDKINDTSFSGKKLNINISMIEEKNKKLEDELIKFLGNYISGRMVQAGNPELEEILEIDDEEERNKKFAKYLNKIEGEALDAFRDQIKDTVASQTKIVSDEINVRLSEVNDSVNDSLTTLNEIVNSKKNDGNKLEEIKVEAMYEMTLCDILINEISA